MSLTVDSHVEHDRCRANNLAKEAMSSAADLRAWGESATRGLVAAGCNTSNVERDFGDVSLCWKGARNTADVFMKNTRQHDGSPASQRSVIAFARQGNGATFAANGSPAVGNRARPSL